MAYAAVRCHSRASLSARNIGRYFPLLGVTPALGRVWSNDERDAIVMQEQFWRDTLHGDPGVVGKAITVDGRTRTIVGVMPSRIRGAILSRARLLGATRHDAAPCRRAHATHPHGSCAAYAPARRGKRSPPISRCSRHWAAVYPAAHGGQSWVAKPLRDELVGPARPALIGTAAAAALLLLIVGANIAGLSTAHAVASRHQLAVRAALGATRGRLFVEQLVDSARACGWSAPCPVCGWRTGLSSRREISAAVPRTARADRARCGDGRCRPHRGVDHRVVAAALLPRSVVSAARPGDALRHARGSSGDLKVTATRTGLVVAQIALAFVLLVGAGLLVRTVQHLSAARSRIRERRASPGCTSISPAAKYRTDDAQIQFERAVLERVAAR